MDFKNLDTLCKHMNELYERQQWNFMDSDIHPVPIEAWLLCQAELDDLTQNAPRFGGSEPACTMGIVSWDLERLLVIDDRGYAICTREEWEMA